MDIKQFQRAAGISEVLAARWYLHITAAMKEFGIEQPLHRRCLSRRWGMSHRLYPAAGEL
jgi:predicted chitinase